VHPTSSVNHRKNSAGSQYTCSISQILHT
jgi:hypothetical protein